MIEYQYGNLPSYVFCIVEKFSTLIAGLEGTEEVAGLEGTENYM